MSEKAKQTKNGKPKRSDRLKLTAEESLKRMEEFPKRRESIIAAVRKNKSRSVSS